ncbi:MAG TPA: TonB-dependent receptor [Candidatus Binatia bacterium]|nr:TonB-dependent receptor [Candidatus Binatia bacterium]
MIHLRNVFLLVICAQCSLLPATSTAAEIIAGTISGRVVSAQGRTGVGGADVAASSPSARYRVRTDSSGRYTIVNVVPDEYTVAVSAPGYEPQTFRVAVLPNAHVTAEVAILTVPGVIGFVTRRVQGGSSFGEPSQTYTITGEKARGLPSASSSGLGSYTQGAIQGAVAAAPGVQQDPFANVILLGGKVEDTVFSYDGVPIPQALIAEPGGNVVGAQLPTTGAGYTTITSGGLSTSSNQGLSGEIDEIPATGVYPEQTSLSLSQAIIPGGDRAELQSRWATPSLQQRYAIDARIGADQFQYGDGTTFYPSEAATYGLSLANRATWSLAANVHLRSGRSDDVSFVGLAGQAVYDQYGTPFAGETYGAFNGMNTIFPGEPASDAIVTTPSRVRGTYAVAKVQDVRTYGHSLARLQLYSSMYTANTVAPFFDDLSYPNGVISYFGQQSGRLYGLGLDARNVASEHHELSYGVELQTQTSYLNQIVATLDSQITSQPTLNSYLFYVSDRWSPTSRFVLNGTARLNQWHALTSGGNGYQIGALDPHAGANYRFAPHWALLATYDHTTVAPLPLEVERNDTRNPTPFSPLAPEIGDKYGISIEHDAPVRSRLTYFIQVEHNLIDVLPADFRSAIASGESPLGVGIPTNAGNLLAHGLELSVDTGRFSLAATYTRGFSSSASQFGYNDLNGPAAAAGHLFPVGYIPDFSAIASYRATIGPVTVTPTLSYQTGYPYGNGKSVFVFDSVTGKPLQVPNDNHVNPGFNYYFLRDPSQPFNVLTNPYIGSLGTPEGNDPNTLRSLPQLLASIHLTADLGMRTRLVLDVNNLFGNANPTQLQGNPYLIGPPGYQGGNSSYAAWYGRPYKNPYTLGNGVPTNNGQSAAVPWTYGTNGYVPSSYPNARAIYVRLEERL